MIQEDKKMPRCEITGIAQLITMECLHPKYKGKQAGYLTCKSGRTLENGVPVCKGACPNFIKGSGTEDIWCRLRKEKNEIERIDREIEKVRRKR